MKGNKGGLEGGTGQEWASQERAWTKGGEKPGPRTARQPQSFPVGPGAVPHLPPRGAGGHLEVRHSRCPSPSAACSKRTTSSLLSLTNGCIGDSLSPQPFPY